METIIGKSIAEFKYQYCHPKPRHECYYSKTYSSTDASG